MPNSVGTCMYILFTHMKLPLPASLLEGRAFSEFNRMAEDNVWN